MLEMFEETLRKHFLRICPCIDKRSVVCTFIQQFSNVKNVLEQCVILIWFQSSD